MLVKFGRPTTLGESLRDHLGLPEPERAPLRAVGEAVRVILDGEARVAAGRYVGPDRRNRGCVRVRIAPRAAGVSNIVSVPRWRVLKGCDDVHHGGG